MTPGVQVGLAAACMARGLTAEEADKVQRLLARDRTFPSSAKEAFEQIDRAVNQVRAERNRR